MAAVAVDSVNGEFTTDKVTLTGGAADTVTFSGDLDELEIISDGTADLFVRYDGSAATASSKKSWRLPAGGLSVRTFKVPGTYKVFSVFSTGATAYTLSKVS